MPRTVGPNSDGKRWLIGDEGAQDPEFIKCFAVIVPNQAVPRHSNVEARRLV